MTPFRYGNRLSHPSILERLTLAALKEGDYQAAFRFIDRRCRIAPAAIAYHYVLRAEILNFNEKKKAALASLRRALEITPEDLPANRRMLRWGEGAEQKQAARALCDRDLDQTVLVEAASTLRLSGETLVGAISVFEGEISGWAAWDGEDAPKLLTIENEEKLCLEFQPDKTHPLLESGFAKACAFRWPRVKDEALQAVVLTAGESRIVKRILSGRTQPAPPPLKRSRKQKTALTVVIPVYRDIEATKACLDSLGHEMTSFANCRIVIVNDASPEAGMAAMLARFVKKSGAELLTNARNLGFVGAVNRALATVTGGDILLLNADAVLPKGALQRLAATAHADPRIGTITPLSNNGEYTSFPVSLRANPMPSMKELDRLDGLTARVNKGRVIDVPSGIGFCLYISEACFQAVGGLTDCFHNGYLEDVDLCLRARENGFRNVCDTSVFVAHAGSRSFLADKRNLVVRNLPIIEERFPNHQRESDLFVQQDPLRIARAALEKEACAGAKVDVLMVTGVSPLVQQAAVARAEALCAKGESVWLLEQREGSIRIKDAAKALPQSLRFELLPDDTNSLSAFLGKLKIGRIEIADAARMPPLLLGLLQACKKPIDLYLTDATWVRSTKLETAQLCLEAARSIIVPDKAAEAFAKKHLSGHAISCASAGDMKTAVVRKAPWAEGNKACGIIGLCANSTDAYFMKELSLVLRKKAPKSELIILGETLDDIDLMMADNTFVSGAVDDEDLSELSQLYGIRKLFVLRRTPFFGDPLLESVRETGLPFAYFDWAEGRGKKGRTDLALEHDASIASVATALADWMEW